MPFFWGLMHFKTNAKFSKKIPFLHFSRTCARAHTGLRNVSFSENVLFIQNRCSFNMQAEMWKELRIEEFFDLTKVFCYCTIKVSIGKKTDCDLGREIFHAIAGGSFADFGGEIQSTSLQFYNSCSLLM